MNHLEANSAATLARINLTTLRLPTFFQDFQYARPQISRHVAGRIRKGTVALLNRMRQFESFGKDAEPLRERIGSLLDLFRDAELLENPKIELFARLRVRVRLATKSGELYGLVNGVLGRFRRGGVLHCGLEVLDGGIIDPPEHVKKPRIASEQTPARPIRLCE